MDTPNDPPLRWIDRLTGPGATPAERTRVAAAAVGGLALGILTVHAPLLDTAVLALLSAETTAGLVNSMNPAAKAWQHRPALSPAAKLARAALALIPLALFVWLFRAGDLQRFLIAALFLVAGAMTVLAAPPRSQRAVGLVGVLVAMTTIDQTVGLVREAAWFPPLLFTRVLIGYLPAPLPARPSEV